MKNQYRYYLSALTRYEEEVSRLSETTRRNVAKEIIDRAKLKKIPLQKDDSLIEQLVDHEHRVPAQLYAVIGEIVRLIKQIDQT